MPEPLLPSPLYAILDTGLCGSRPPLEMLAELLSGGVKLVQLRAKGLRANEYFELAKQARDATRRAGAMLVVNDRVDIALAVRADGVHLGQDDLPLAAAASIAGGRLIIGI